jgi:hypothetical protein
MERNAFVIEIRRGSGNPRHVELSPGTTVNPMSIGMMGDWRVEADGMLDVHAFVYYDGKSLFVQSADARNAVRVNGKPVGPDWSPITPPCTLAIGDARLVYCPASQASAAPSAAVPASARPAAGRAAFDEDAPTRADFRPDDYDDAVSTTRTPAPDEDATGSIPIPPAPGGLPHEGTGEDNETTRALPLPVMPSPMMGAPKPPPPPMGMAVGMGVADASGPIAAPPPAAPVVEKPKPLDQLKKGWKEASLPKKAIAVLLPVAFIMVIFGLDDDPKPAPANKPAPSASASEKTAKTVEKPTKKTAEPEDIDEPPPAPSTTGKPAPSISAKTPSPAPSQKSLERAAVDAVAAGSYESAAKMYEELAKAHPENPAYKQAAKILRAKAKK